jgi:transcription initiation factor IIE alpha subunit
MQAAIDTKQTRIDSFHSAQTFCNLQQKMVYDALCVHAPLTDEEIGELTGLNGNSVRPRRGELVSAGLVVPSGFKVTRSGRKAVSWITKNNWRVNNYG